MKILIASVLVASLATGAATYKYVKSEYEREIALIEKKHAQDKATALGKMLSEQIAMTKEWANKEKVLHDEKANAERIESALRKRVRDGEQRLSVILKTKTRVCETTNTASVDNGTQRAELDEAFAERIVTIANDGDAAIRQLTACQSYISSNMGQ